MKFIIVDKLTKEISGLFSTKEEAEYYYVKNNVSEKLKYYCNRLVNKSENMENIELIRKFENLLNQIYDYETNDNNFNFSYFMTIADELLFKYADSDTEYHKIISVLNCSFLRFDEDNFNRHKY
jgi:hypothetical protein